MGWRPKSSKHAKQTQGRIEKSLFHSSCPSSPFFPCFSFWEKKASQSEEKTKARIEEGEGEEVQAPSLSPILSFPPYARSFVRTQSHTGALLEEEEEEEEEEEAPETLKFDVAALIDDDADRR